MRHRLLLRLILPVALAVAAIGAVVPAGHATTTTAAAANYDYDHLAAFAQGGYRDAPRQATPPAHGIECARLSTRAVLAAEDAPSLLTRLSDRVGGFSDERGSIRFSRGNPLTNSQAADMANRLGFRATNRLIKGQRVFTDGRRYIVQDIDAHLPDGLWKMASTVDDLKSKATRLGTYDYDLNRIGP